MKKLTKICKKKKIKKTIKPTWKIYKSVKKLSKLKLCKKFIKIHEKVLKNTALLLRISEKFVEKLLTNKEKDTKLLNNNIQKYKKMYSKYQKKNRKKN